MTNFLKHPLWFWKITKVVRVGDRGRSKWEWVSLPPPNANDSYLRPGKAWPNKRIGSRF